MKTTTKVIFNTIVLYAKILASMAIALVSVPLVLKALGASDYGLFNLVAGVVAMLGFLNNSLTVSSQRYMSVAMGEGNVDRINLVYNTSFYLHILLGLCVAALLEIGVFFIDYLNIEPERLWCAKIVYQFLIVSTFLRIATVPFDALINAHEDMIVFAVIEMIDSILMLGIAFSLVYIPFDRLAFYGLGVCLISFFAILMKYVWCSYKYKDYRLNKFTNRKVLLTKEMSGFAGWNLFGGLAMIGRNQGIAIIINLFLGTIANAAYGIANHINSALSHFSVTFQKAINPQLMKSEGMNNRDRLLRISYISSKFSVLALSFFAVPLIIEMSDVLNLWIGKDMPSFTVELSQYILIMTIVYQYSMGIMSAIQATGNIRNYQITMSIIILMNVPLSLFLVWIGKPVYYVAIGFVFLELISLIVRIKMASMLVGMPIIDYLFNVVKPTLLIIIPSAVIGIIFHCVINTIWPRIICTSLVYGIVFVILSFLVALNDSQRMMIVQKVSILNNRRK